MTIGLPPLPMALQAQILSYEPIKGRVANIGMLRESNHTEYIWHITFLRVSDGKLMRTYVSALQHEIDNYTYDAEIELMEIFQRAIHEMLVNG